MWLSWEKGCMMKMEYGVCFVFVFLFFCLFVCWFFFFNDTATTEIYTLSLHDALPISSGNVWMRAHSLTDRRRYFSL